MAHLAPKANSPSKLLYVPTRPIQPGGPRLTLCLRPLHRCLESSHRGPPGETYNIGGCNEKTNLSVVELILARLGKPKSLIKHVIDRPGHDRRYAIDASKIIKQLKWQPSVSFEQGLGKTIDWFLANRNWLANVVSGDYKKYYESMYENR